MIESAKEIERTRMDEGITLPLPLQSLERLSWNYWWSWAADGASVFRDLDPEIWEECEHNPRLLLARVSEYRLAQMATDPVYIDRVRRLSDCFDQYIGPAESWVLMSRLARRIKDKRVLRVIRRYLQAGMLSQGPTTARSNQHGETTITPDRGVAYFCAEYGVHNSLPLYSGGLGMLAGDHLKSASDLRLPLVAVGLLYRYGCGARFSQRPRPGGAADLSNQDSRSNPATDRGLDT